MKRKLIAALTLLLCLSLCLILAPGAFAEEALTPVRFYSEKGYDLVGLQVRDADGQAVAPDDTGDGYRYLLAPGAYSYVYHDSRDIFLDIAETGFTVGGDAVEMPVPLAASFVDYYAAWYTAPLSEGGDESAILAAMPTREEAEDRLIETLLAQAAKEEGGFFLSDSDVFYAPPGYSSDIALKLRQAMVQRQESVELIFESNTQWSDADFDDAFNTVIIDAVRHTGDHREGDTLKKNISSYGIELAGHSSGGIIVYQLTFTILYKTSYAQEAATIDAVTNLVRSLSLAGKSDYDKVLAIHQWLCTNVTYDYTHLDTPSYQLQFTDYAALIDRCAVCQGYATAFYRLCLAAGVDARYITSIQMNHGWNIARVDGRYYYVDSTWDADDSSTFQPYFFLRGSDWWLSNHKDTEGRSGIGDEFDHNSYMAYMIYNEETAEYDFFLDYYLLQDQYAEFDACAVPACDYDPFSSLVPDFVLPDALTAIGDEAFVKGAFVYVLLPESIASVGRRAFADCPNLRYIYIPDGTAVDDEAFSGVSGLTVLSTAESSAKSYAQSHGFAFLPAA